MIIKKVTNNKYLRKDLDINHQKKNSVLTLKKMLIKKKTTNKMNQNQKKNQIPNLNNL